MQFNPLDYPATQLDPLFITRESAWIEHIPLAYSLIEMVQPSRLVELGVHAGDSYCAFCQAVAHLQVPTQCFGVDTWQGDQHAGTYAENVLKELRGYHDPKYGIFSKLMQTTFDLALAHFEDGSIDLLHIDGLHTYEAVKHDFETWLPKMSDRGVVLFHDTAVRAADFGVYRLWEEVAAKYSGFEFKHGYGLGILAVGKEVPPNLLPLLSATGAEAEVIRKFYLREGREVAMRRYYRDVMLTLMKGQSLINQWKQQTGQAIVPGSQDFKNAMNNPIGMAQELVKDIHVLATGDLNLRKQIQGSPAYPKS